jgi:glycosyltransferase involved in cell wall biosynthesis
MEMKHDARFAGDVRLEFIGEVHPDFREFVAADPALAKVTVFTGNIPHEKLISVYGSSALLLFVLSGYKDAEGFLPGKLFEYLAAGCPVMGVGPVAGDAADLLRDTGAGKMIDTKDEAGMRKTLRDYYRRWQTEGPGNITTAAGAVRYSRKHVTGELVRILQDQLDKAGLEEDQPLG